MSTEPNQIIIFDFMRTLYDPEQGVLIEGAENILKDCHKIGHTLYLVSQKEGQRQGIMSDLDIEKYFKKIYLVDNKRTAMESIKKKHPTKSIWVIGDRIRGEISDGNEIGAETIWLQTGKFAHECAREEKEKPTHTISNLSEIKNII